VKLRLGGAWRVLRVSLRLWVASLILSAIALAISGLVAGQNMKAIASYLRSGDGGAPSTIPTKIVRPLWWIGANQPGVNFLRVVPGVDWVPASLSAVSASWGSATKLADEGLAIAKAIDAGVIEADGSFNAKTVNEVAKSASKMREPIKEIEGLVRFFSVDRGPLWQMPERAELAQKIYEAYNAALGGIESLELVDELFAGEKPRTIFLGITNSAETRGVHGIIGQYAIVEVDKSGINVRELDSNLALKNPSKIPDGLSSGYSDFYGSNNPEWQNMTLSPFVDDAAEQILNGWQELRGENLDGVVLLDTVALGRVATIGEKKYMSAQGRLLESAKALSDYLSNGIYLEFPIDNLERKVFQTELGRQIVDEILDQLGDARKFVPALTPTLREGRIAFWAGESLVDDAAQRVRLGLQSENFAADKAVIRLNNFSGNKMDFYLKPSLSVATCEGTTNLKIELQNLAPPREELPDYVLRRLDPIGGNPGSFVGLELTVGSDWEISQWSEASPSVDARFLESSWGQRLRVWLDVPIGQTRQGEVLLTRTIGVGVSPVFDLAALSSDWSLGFGACSD
jgi:hypothetical protein